MKGRGTVEPGEANLGGEKLQVSDSKSISGGRSQNGRPYRWPKQKGHGIKEKTRGRLPSLTSFRSSVQGKKKTVRLEDKKNGAAGAFSRTTEWAGKEGKESHRGLETPRLGKEVDPQTMEGPEKDSSRRTRQPRVINEIGQNHRGVGGGLGRG